MKNKKKLKTENVLSNSKYFGKHYSKGHIWRKEDSLLKT